MANRHYTITEGPYAGETWYDGRYCGVSGIVLLQKGTSYYILANKRGKGSADFKHLWNLPCGFLENTESGPEGVVREIFEECGVSIPKELFTLYDVETEPEKCHKGHVTIRYIAFITDELPGIDFSEFNHIGSTGGEQDEVEDRKWIPIQDYKNYDWAFNHEKVIEDLIKIYNLN